MLGLSCVVADSDEEARRLFTSQQQAVINLRTGRPGKLPPPIDDIDSILDGRGHMILDSVLSCAVVGSPATVREGLDAFVARHRPDELMATAHIYDHQARLRSYALLREAWPTV
jgi:alkanesulfonate monooxygenase SsuD/methylene tetrahydromethanopterin reductase-like flavin-dependent oxidoreductase (luciferase family)